MSELQECIETLLRANCKLFEKTDFKKAQKLLIEARPTIRHFHQGAIIFFRGDVYERLNIIVEGKASAEIIDMDGRVLKVESLEAPELIASGILFSDTNILPVQLTADTDVCLFSISKSSLIKMCMQDEHMLQKLYQDMGNRITFLAEKLRMLGFDTIKEKIAAYFLDLAEKQNNLEISLPYSLEVTAELFGVSRPSLSRSLSSLVEEGILEKKGRNYIITDRQYLKNELVND